MVKLVLISFISNCDNYCLYIEVEIQVQIIMELSHNFVVTGTSGELETNFFYPVRLEEGYELALNYFFCGPVCNVNSERDLLYLVKGDGDGQLVEEKLLLIPHGYYHTTGELINKMVETINEFMTQNESVWGTGKARADFNVGRQIWTLILPKKQHVSIAHDKNWERNILNIFSSLDEGNYEELIVVESKFDESIESVFIYSSVIQESFIDVNQSRLLAVIPVRTNAKYTHYEPKNLRFYKIAIEEFSSIFIELRNSRGKLVEFEGCDEDKLSKCPKKHVILGLTLRNLYK